MKVANEVRIGLLGVIAIVIFILGYNFLKGKGIFANKRTVTAVYSDVGGLKPANRISLNGFDVGTVNDIYVTDGDINKGITVEMAIDNDIKIPKNSKAYIVSDGLLGTKAIKLELGNSTEYLAGAGTILGDIEYGLFDKVGAELDPILNDLKGTLSSLDTAVSGIKNILNPTAQQQLKGTIAKLDRTMTEFSGLAASLGQQKKKINKVMTNLDGFSTNLNKNNGTINRTLSNLETTTQNFSKIKLEQTVTKLNTTLSSLQSTLGKVNSNEGSIGLLMNDDKLYKNLRNTSETLNNLLYDLSARPYRYVNLNLFGGKKKASPPLKAPNADK